MHASEGVSWSVLAQTVSEHQPAHGVNPLVTIVTREIASESTHICIRAWSLFSLLSLYVSLFLARSRTHPPRHAHTLLLFHTLTA